MMRFGVQLLFLTVFIPVVCFGVTNYNFSVSVPVGGGVTALIHLDGEVDVGVTPGAVYYDKKGQIKKVGDSAVVFDNEGRILKIGMVAVVYDGNGRAMKVGSIPLNYDHEGRLSQIGMAFIKYFSDGSIKMVSPMDGTLLFLGVE